jgi:TetR/AcrR family transcriptional regulator, cholesterol catabolism regulator
MLQAPTARATRGPGGGGHAATQARAGVPPGRRERNKLEVYRRIREAAVELFRQHGYEATTVEQIAERADVAKGTVFNYFPRKESLLEALAADAYVKLMDELGPPETWTGSARDRIVRLLLTLAGVAQEDRVVFRLVLHKNVGDFWREAQGDPLGVFIKGAVRAALREGRSRGELTRTVRLDAAARVLEAAFLTTMLDWLNGGIADRAFRRELAAQLDVVFAGLAVPAARRTAPVAADGEAGGHHPVLAPRRATRMASTGRHGRPRGRS